MVSLEDSILAKFPHKSLTAVTGEPEYKQLRTLRSQAYGNVSAVPSPYGGGAHGHLGAVMPDANYFQKTGHHFIIPADPGDYDLTIANNATNAIRGRMEAAHTATKLAFDTCAAVQLAIKNLLINAVELTYLDELNDDDHGFLLSTPENIIDHLMDRYGEISEWMITENKNAMDEGLDVTLPFATYTKRIEKCMQLAIDAGTPYTDAQIVQIGVVAITKTGEFNEGYLRWCRKPAADKSWVNYKTHFNQEFTEWRNLSKMTARQSGYGANAITGLPEELSNAFDNLALAATTDKATLDTLTRQLTNMADEMTKLNEDNRRLHKLLETSWGKSTGSGEKPPATGAKKGLDPKGYCWTHGYRVSPGHDGHGCNSPADGHKKEATRSDNMGGSQKGKPGT